MRDLSELLTALDNVASDAARSDVNARIRAVAARDPEGTRAFLEARRICDPEEASAAMSLVEALAGGDDRDLGLLPWYFDVAAKQVLDCPSQESAVQVLTTFAFLEHGSGTRKHAMLPRYLDLTRSPSAAHRRAAVDLLGGFKVATASGARDALVRLLADPDAEVRRGAEALLREEGVLPDGYRPSLVDRLRRMFQS